MMLSRVCIGLSCICLWDVLVQNGASSGQIISLTKTRTITSCGFFQDMIRRGIYSRIDYKFLIAGHTYCATDQTFCMIEHYTSRIDTVYIPEQWYQHVRNASIGIRSVEVVKMEQKFFCDIRQHLRKIYTERNKDVNNQALDFQRIVWFNFGKGEKEVDGELALFDHPEDVWVRYCTYNLRETPQCVSYCKKKESP